MTGDGVGTQNREDSVTNRGNCMCNCSEAGKSLVWLKNHKGS